MTITNRKNTAIKIGRFLRCSRIEKDLSHSKLFTITGISTLNLHHIESGNYEHFNDDFEHFLMLANSYSKALNVQLDFVYLKLGREPQTTEPLTVPDDHIPAFLRKQNPSK